MFFDGVQAVFLYERLTEQKNQKANPSHEKKKETGERRKRRQKPTAQRYESPTRRFKVKRNGY